MSTPPRRPKQFTMRFPWEEAMDLDRAILNHSARIGRRIDRTEAIRGLARLFVTDPEVAERAIQAAVELAHDGRNGGRQAEPDRGLDKGEPDTGLGF